MEQRTYRNLKSLNNSDYQVVDGEPNIVGWEVKNQASIYVGEVKDLLFDPETNAVRYLIIDLDDNGMSLGDKKVMVPIGIANLHTSEDEVVLPNIHIDQFGALPAYDENATTPATEVLIRDIIGSPAALRIEEKTAEFDQDQFYSHHHFDTAKFYQRSGNYQSGEQHEFTGDRSQQQQTIHNLVEDSKDHNFHAADEQTGLGTHHNEGRRLEDEDNDENYPNNNTTSQ